MTKLVSKVARNILLNPGPGTTTDSVKFAQVVPDICPREKEFCNLIESVRQGLLEVINAEASHEAVFVPGSGTAAIECALSSVVPEGAKILVVRNGSYGRRMYEISVLHYGEQRVVSPSFGDEQVPDLEAIEGLLVANPDVSHLAIVHHETTTGLLNPVEEVFAIAQRHGVEVIVDAMSSYAGIPIDLARVPYQYVISSSNKCVQGMAGIGFVIARKESIEALRDIPPRSLYLSLWGHYDFLKRKGQIRFTPPVQAFYALKQALEELKQEGYENRCQRYQENWSFLTRELERLGLRTLLPKEVHSKVCTAILEPTSEAYSFQGLHDYFMERGITIYPGIGGETPNFRISNLGDLHLEDMVRVIEVLEAYLREVLGW